MKYYAVTNDPTELMHFGIKGMHWGIIRTDAQLGHPRHSGSRRPRSAAYKKAQSKLGKAMKNGIEKAKANWREYNSPERKYERQTNKALQQARKGKLKYGKLDDWQVQRITDRLAMERNARMLSDTEKTWGKRLRESIGEGVIRGVGDGFGRRTSEWISRGSVLKTDRKRKEQANAMDIEQRRVLDAMNLEQQRREQNQKFDIDREHERQQMVFDRKNARKKALAEMNADYQREAVKRGYNSRIGIRLTNGGRAKLLREWNAENEKNANADEYSKNYKRAYAIEAAKGDAKKIYGETKKEGKKSKKEKNKTPSPGASQAPVINVYYDRPSLPDRQSFGYPSKRSGGRDRYKGRRSN